MNEFYTTFRSFRISASPDRWGKNLRVYYKDHKLVEFCKFKFSLQLINWSEDHGSRWSLEIFGLFLSLPDRYMPNREAKDNMLDAWGFGCFDKAFMVKWGSKSKFFYFPLINFEHIDSKQQRLLMRLDNFGGYLFGGTEWVTYPSWKDEDQEERTRQDFIIYTRSYPYHYMLDNGEVQTVEATISQQRRVWHRKGLPSWLPFFQKKSHTIEVSFSEELGERRGSWKGGCTGCSYEMKPFETPKDTLMRMQRERRFR